MKARTLVLSFALSFIGATTALAQAPQMGTWKLDEAKSKVPANYMKNSTVTYEADGDNVKVTTEGVDAKGNPMRTEWTGKFDGKDYPLTGDPAADSRAYKLVNDNTLTLENKKDGKVITQGRVTVAADGKTRTLKVTGPDATGKKVTVTAVYTKE
jgi:hypothetical protein